MTVPRFPVSTVVSNGEAETRIDAYLFPPIVYAYVTWTYMHVE